jgi:diketogulonate reductase-like aldo/keto reductase
LSEPVVVSIAKKHNKTPAQVLLRHLTQLGVVVIPKSVNPSRIQQNFQIFDFFLNDEEMQQMNALDQGAKGRYFSMDNFGNW